MTSLVGHEYFLRQHSTYHIGGGLKFCASHEDNCDRQPSTTCITQSVSVMWCFFLPLFIRLSRVCSDCLLMFIAHFSLTFSKRRLFCIFILVCVTKISQQYCDYSFASQCYLGSGIYFFDTGKIKSLFRKMCKLQIRVSCTSRHGFMCAFQSPHATRRTFTGDSNAVFKSFNDLVRCICI
jgi:hypothetical protein